MTSRERIIRTMRGERTDRIPIWFLRSRNPFPAIDAEEAVLFRDGWKNHDENFKEFVRYCTENGTDVLQMFSFKAFDRRFLLISDEYVLRESRKVDDQTYLITYTVRTPGGKLTYEEMFKRDVTTVWLHKPLVESVADAEKLLSVPYEFEPFDTAPFFAEQEALGEKGLLSPWVSNPLVCVSHLLRFENFFIWCAQERSLMERLLETACERINTALEYILVKNAGPIIRFGGTEQATPPMMSPEMFDAFVVRYDSRLMELVHRHGKLVHLHCHGKIKAVLEKLVQIGVDATDPVEGPPSGDVTLAQAKRRVGDRMTLIGNIQISDFEFLSSGEMYELAKRTVMAGGKGRFMLSASDYPLSRMSDRMLDNFKRAVDAGLEFGRWTD